MILSRFLLVLACLALTATAHAAPLKLTRLAPNPMGCSHLLQGQLTADSAEQVMRLVSEQRYSTPVLCLDSPGGSLIEGLQMARFFRSYGVPTRVRDGDSCMSACAVAFMGGTEMAEGAPLDRAIHARARLGFHAPSLSVPDGNYGKSSVDKAYYVAVQGIAEVLGAAHEIAMPINAVETMLRTPAAEFYDIATTGRALDWGVQVEGIPAPTRISPPMWLNGCMNLAGHHRGTGPFLPAGEQYVRPRDGGATVTLGFGTVSSFTCRFEMFGDGNGGFMGWGYVAGRDDLGETAIALNASHFSGWHAVLSDLAGTPPAAPHKGIIPLRRAKQLPCSALNAGVVTNGTCSVDEIAVMQPIGQDKKLGFAFAAAGEIEISGPGDQNTRLQADEWGSFPWDDYAYTPEGEIFCAAGDQRSRLCIAETQTGDFTARIRARCLAQAAAPFQIEGTPGVPIWSINSTAAEEACGTATLFDDATLNATTALARTLYSAGDHQGALALFLAAAKAGNATAQNGTGIAYLYGKGTARDRAEAALWFAKARDQGNPFAYLHSGAMAEQGLGRDISLSDAFAAYETAADLGATGGWVRIGNHHRAKGDFAKAAQYYRMAADQQDGEALAHLAALTFEGHLEGGPSAAAQFYAKAAAAGDRAAAYELSRKLSKGALPADSLPLSADDYLLQAAEAGLSNALVGYSQTALAGGDQDLAREFLLRAADLKHPLAEALLENLN